MNFVNISCKQTADIVNSLLIKGLIKFIKNVKFLEIKDKPIILFILWGSEGYKKYYVCSVS